MWLVRANSYHLKSAAMNISGYLIVPSGDKEEGGEVRSEMQEKEVERIQSY